MYGGVNDPRMGTFSFNTRCKTCDCTYTGSGSKVNDCPGHFGHIELARPVYHVGFIDDVVKILRCVCYHCSRLLLDKNDYKCQRVLKIKDPATRLRAIHDLCKSKKRCETGSANEMRDELLHTIGFESEAAGESAAGNSGCGSPMPNYSRSGLEIKVDFPEDMIDIPGTGDRKQTLPSHRAYEILKGTAMTPH